MTLTVPCTGSGGGPAGLAAAIESADAGGGGTITLTASCNYSFAAPYANTGSEDLAGWYGPAALPAIASQITIVGNGATISRASTAPPFRLFFVGANPTAAATSGWTTPGAGALTLENVTLSGGLAQGGSGGSGGGGGGLGAGGAIYNQGSTVLEAVTLSGNAANGGSNNGAGGGKGGGGTGANAASSTTNTGGGFGSGFVAPANAPKGGAGGDGLTTSGGGGGAGFGTGESGAPAGTILIGGGPGKGGGPLTGTAGDGQSGNGSTGGDGGGGGSGPALLATGSNGGAYGAGGLGAASGGAGGGGVGGGGGGAANGAGGGFGGGGGYPGGEGGFGAGGAGGSGGAGFGGGAGGATAGGGGAGMGGAIFNQQGSVFATNVTLSANTAAGGSGATAGAGLGGAIFSLNGLVGLVNDTVAANTADNGGALYVVGYDANSANTAGAAFLVNDILSGSVTGTSGATPDLVVAKPSTVADGTGNKAVAAAVTPSSNIVTSTSSTGVLSGAPSTADPMLGPLAFNGGPGMFTMVPGAGSPALGAGTTSGAPTTDERGTPRPADGPIDLGAVQVSTASTPPPPPTVPAPRAETGPATGVTTSKATLTGAVNPEGETASYHFEYGLSASYGAKTSTASLPAGSSGVIVNAKLSNLRPGTTYHYRVVATSAGGTTNGLDASFKTARIALAGLPVTARPRHALSFPYHFKFSGKLRLPRGITSATGCNGGAVFVLIRRHGKTIWYGYSTVGKRCTWSVPVKLGKRKAVPRHGTLSVTVRFAGNTLFLPLTDKAFTVLYG